MDQGNGTSVAEFVLLGLFQAWEVQLILFLLFMPLYLLILLGNVLIILAIQGDLSLGTPMYFLLAKLVCRRVCCVQVGAAWTGGFVHVAILVGLTIRLPFCGPNVLNNLFCDVHQVIRLACTDTYTMELLTFANNGLVILMPFLLLVISYTVLLAKLRMHSPKGKSKADAACITHIIVIFVIYGITLEYLRRNAGVFLE